MERTSKRLKQDCMGYLASCYFSEIAVEIPDTHIYVSSFSFQYNLDYSMNFDEQGQQSCDEKEKLVTEQSDLLLSRLIHRLTIVLVQYLPSFWRLATTIFNGKFGKVYEHFTFQILEISFCGKNYSSKSK